ncbi:AAA family ATPase [Thomasclavelia cocleata]|uniref:AAA family ATPase n=1 Tax=Thomasclavelia cocleata TaxID=69824 RepID=UPI00258DA82D|nr:AAA family ATPase [Thomasclavelia cocleata]
MPITQRELLEKEFKTENKAIFGNILKPGLYVLSGTSKVGKSIIATTMANCIANGTDFLGKSMPKGKAIYFDNDNYDFETKSRIIALNLLGIDEILYEFNDSKSIHDINEVLSNIQDIDQYRLVIIDSYVGLEEVVNSNDNYFDVYPILKELRDHVVYKKLVCIIIHHTKKGKEKLDQDNMLGSKALSGATTGSLLLSVRNEFDKHGQLKLILRGNKSIIKIKKDENNIGWLLDEDKNSTTEEIPKNILSLINTVVNEKEHILRGTCQEIVQKSKMEINPNYLTKYLKQNQQYLEENNITFHNERNGQKRTITIEYHEEDIQQVTV